MIIHPEHLSLVLVDEENALLPLSYDVAVFLNLIK
jgi:hypothetical protein